MFRNAIRSSNATAARFAGQVRTYADAPAGSIGAAGDAFSKREVSLSLSSINSIAVEHMVHGIMVPPICDRLCVAGNGDRGKAGRASTDMPRIKELALARFLSPHAPTSKRPRLT